MTPSAAGNPAESEDGAEPPFALVLPFRPISSQSSGRVAYQARVRRAAVEAFGDRSPLEGPLYARVTYLHLGPSTQDIDNILKRLLDALKGVVYADDGTIRQCLVERIAIAERFVVAQQHQPPGIVGQLIGLLAAEHPHITYIEVGHATDQVVWFGPIRGEVG